jgi:hypothetical protein
MLFDVGRVGRQTATIPRVMTDAGVYTSPTLDLDLTSTLDSRITFTRAAGSQTYFNSAGVLTVPATNEPRFDYDPVTLQPLGLLVEDTRTNLFLNSATLVTQTVTVGAVANTLSFYGTGTVTLSGVSTAGPLVGTGVNNRVSLIFTPTAGALLCTVTGSVTNAQIEAGAFPSSYIPTTGVAATRAAEPVTRIPVGPWFNAAQGTLTAEGYFRTIPTTQITELVGLGQSSSDLYRLSIGLGQSVMSLQAFAATVNQYNATTVGSIVANALVKAGMTYNLTGLAVKHVTNGGAVTSGVASSTMPGTPTTLYIGGAGRGILMYGTTTRIRYWPRVLTDLELMAATT